MLGVDTNELMNWLESFMGCIGLPRTGEPVAFFLTVFASALLFCSFAIANSKSISLTSRVPTRWAKLTSFSVCMLSIKFLKSNPSSSFGSESSDSSSSTGQSADSSLASANFSSGPMWLDIDVAGLVLGRGSAKSLRVLSLQNLISSFLRRH